MFNFEGLPGELKIAILEYLFTDDVYHEASTHDQHKSRLRQVRHHLSLLPSSIDNPANLPSWSWPNSEIVHIHFNLPRAFRTLFTSKSFLTTGLPIFIKSTVLKLQAVDFEYCGKPGFEIPSTSPSLITETLDTILRRTTNIQFFIEHFHVRSHRIPILRDLFPSLLVVTLHDRMTLRRSRTGAGKSTQRDHFLGSSRSRHLLTEKEVQDLKAGLVFPGNLTDLCRYQGVLSGGNPLPPIEIRRIVTVTCYEEVRVGLPHEVQKRELFIDMTIDVLRLKLVDALVRSGDLVDESTSSTPSLTADDAMNPSGFLS